MTIISISSDVFLRLHLSIYFVDFYMPFRVLVKVLNLFSVFISVFEKNFQSRLCTYAATYVLHRMYYYLVTIEVLQEFHKTPITICGKHS